MTAPRNRDGIDPKSVIAAIEAAFDAAPMPAANELTRPIDDPRSRAEADLFAAKLRGRHWSTLDRDFLRRNWAAWCYLTPAAQRHYVPALLRAALEAADLSREPLVHSIAYIFLTPSAYAVYFSGRDAHFDALGALLNALQREAIRKFLHLVMQAVPNHLYLAANALQRGWRDEGSLQTRAADAYFERLHHFAPPPVTDRRAAAVNDSIRAAFDARPCPGDDQLCDSRQGDEPAEYALAFRKLDWRTLHPEFLLRNHAALSFFPDAAFRHFLPAFLIADLVDGSGTDSLFHLTYGLEGDEAPALGERQAGRLGAFTPAEHAAIVAYLQLRLAGDCVPPQLASIRAALDRFWLRPR